MTWDCIEIHWKGKIGYGDIISPICYAHNIAEKHCMDVHLIFHWPHPPENKFHSLDPETIWQRANFVAEHIAPATYQNVLIKHKWNSIIDFNHTNYFDDGPLHNFRFHESRNSPAGSKDFICIVHSLNNQQQFIDYAPNKVWKDPCGYTPSGNSWSNIICHLTDNKLKLMPIDYRTPIQQAIKWLQRCRLVIGYHGSAMWLAKFVGTPMIVFSKNETITKRAFPWAHVYNQYTDFNVSSIDAYRIKSFQQIQLLESEYENYRTEPIRGIRSKRNCSLQSVHPEHPYRQQG